MKKITLLWVLFISTSLAFAQTNLTAGDIAFIGVNTDGVSDSDDNFAFVLLKDIEANTTITFTDRGWNDGTGFFEAVGDGDFSWTASTALNAGEVVVLDFSNLSPTAAAFTVLGDQLFAIQGSIASPTFIAGLHFNVVTGTTDDVNWDSAATSNTTSALPDALTTGNTAIRLTGPGGVENDNFQFSCAIAGCPLSGTPDELRAIIHNTSNWISSNTIPFSGTVDAGFGTPKVGDTTPPMIVSVDPTNGATDVALDAILTATFDEPVQRVSGGGDIFIVNLTTGLSHESFPPSSPRVTFGTNSFSIDPTTDFLPENEYGIAINSNAIEDTSGNLLPSTPTSSWSFTTAVAVCEVTIDTQPFFENIITQEISQELCENDSFFIKVGVSANNGGALTYNWQRFDTDSNAWVDSSFTDPGLPFQGIQLDADGLQFRVVVTSDNGTPSDDTDDCSVTSTVATLTVNPLPIAEIGGTLEICAGNTTVLTASGGISYEWSTGAATAEITVDTAGDYTVMVTDVNGCVDEETVTVVVNDNPTVVAEDASVCLGESLQLSATPAGGSWSGPGVNAMGLFDSSALAAGDYEVTYSVTDSDTCDGSDSATVAVNVLPNPVAQDASVCLGATVQLGASPDGGIWSGTGVSPAGLFDTTGLPAGDYEVTYTVTDSNSCVGETTATVTINPLPIAEIGGTLEICAGNTTVLTASGGTSYEWSTGATTAEITVDTAGDYTVTITDVNGCVNEETVTVVANPIPMIEITGKDSYCNNGNGVELDAGAGYSSYLWSPGGQTTQTIMALSGSYTVEVTNETGCATTSEAYVVVKNEQLSCSINQESLATNHVTEDGVATVYQTGGTGQFTYEWDNGETTQTATKLTYGLHTVKVIDSNGCETSCQIDIAKELYCWTNLIKNVSIVGGNDGAASLKGNGGYRPYTFKWDDGSTEEVNNTLSVGDHYVTITDATGATSQCSITIAAPSKEKCIDFVNTIEQNELATNHLTEDGVATVYTTGGTGNLTYLWDNGETTQTATGLTYGPHTVTVTDSQGCETIGQLAIAKKLYCWTYVVDNVSTYGANDGKASVSGNGGFRPYTFIWEDGSTGEVNDSLAAGTHVVTIMDSSGATSMCSVTISEPGEEVCDGIDNDGDGKVDEGFDQDGDGIADCYDICDQGDDHVDIDNDGIPDACDDDICVKSEMPVLECYQTAKWNVQTCTWEVSGMMPEEPVTGCYETATWNGETCNWDITGGQPEMPVLECYQTAEWNVQTCTWEVSGMMPEEPVTGCYETATWNGETCNWDITGGQPEMPVLECYQTAEWNVQTCTWEVSGMMPEEPVTGCYETATWNGETCNWDITGGQPEMPVLECYQTAEWNVQTCTWEVSGKMPEEPKTECYETASWNGETCKWDITGEQPEMPVLECYQSAEWNVQTCEWEVTGEQPMEPLTECYETAEWNAQTCSWDITGEQPEMPQLECYQNAEWNAQTCEWEVTGEQPMEPLTECYETASWNGETCKWDITGEQPQMPQLECYQNAEWNAQTCEWEVTGEQPMEPEIACNETAVWNEVSCDWDIVENDNDCGNGSIEQCETAFARSSDVNVRTCFNEVPGFSTPRWGWTNQFPSVNGTYAMDVYAAAGQCDITKGALVGNVVVTYENGLLDVTISVLSGYKMEVAQLYVGSDPIPSRNNGDLTVAPGQYPYQDDEVGDFYSYTFENISAGDMDSFYVILHANVCPDESAKRATPLKVELTAFPVPFRENLNLKITSPYNMNTEFSMYNGVGQKVEEFGIFTLKEGNNELSFYINSLPVGIYYLRISSNGVNQSYKIIRK